MVEKKLIVIPLIYLEYQDQKNLLRKIPLMIRISMKKLNANSVRYQFLLMFLTIILSVVIINRFTNSNDANKWERLKIVCNCQLYA